MDFQTLKHECITLQQKVDQLYTSVCRNVLLHDLESLSREHPEIKNVHDSCYSTTGIKFDSNNQSLEIVDDRWAPFLWLFDLQFKNKLRLGDTMAFKDEYYQIHSLVNFDFQLQQELSHIKDEYEQTIMWLQSNPLPNPSEYSYYSDRENVECPCIEDVFKTIVAREATVR